MHDEEVLGKAYDSRLMRRLVTYLRPYKKFVAFALLLILFESILEITFPWLTKIAIDRYITAANMGGLAVIAGVYSRLEIWDEATWNRYKDKTEAASDEIAEQLGALGI